MSATDRMRAEMYAEMRDLLGSGYVQEYYESAAAGFIDIAVHYAGDIAAEMAS